MLIIISIYCDGRTCTASSSLFVVQIIWNSNNGNKSKVVKVGKGGGGRQAVEDNKECLKYGEKFHLRKARPPATRCCALNFYHLSYSERKQ